MTNMDLTVPLFVHRRNLWRNNMIKVMLSMDLAVLMSPEYIIMAYSVKLKGE
jgi:hypothetical protein